MTKQDDYDIQHLLAMQAIGFAAQMLRPHADIYAGLIEAERGMHSYLHITDPTLYMRASRDDGLRQQVALAQAAQAFVRAVQAVRDEIDRLRDAL